MIENKLGRKGPIPEGSQDWNSNGTGLEAGADAEHAAYWIASHGLLILLACFFPCFLFSFFPFLFSFLFSFIFLSFFLLFFKFYVCIFYLCVRYMQYSTCVYTCPQVYMDNLLLLRTPGDKQVTSKPPRSSCLRNTVITDILINMWLFNGRLGDSNSGSCVCAASTTEPSPRLQTGSFLICYFYGIPER